MQKYLLLSTHSDELMTHRCQVFARQKGMIVIKVPPQSSFSVNSLNFLSQRETAHEVGTTFATDYQKTNCLFTEILCVKSASGKHIGCHSVYYVKPVISGPCSDLVGPLVVKEDDKGKLTTAYLMLDKDFQLLDSENFLISL